MALSDFFIIYYKLWQRNLVIINYPCKNDDIIIYVFVCCNNRLVGRMKQIIVMINIEKKKKKSRFTNVFSISDSRVYWQYNIIVIVLRASSTS